MELGDAFYANVKDASSKIFLTLYSNIWKIGILPDGTFLYQKFLSAPGTQFDMCSMASLTCVAKLSIDIMKILNQSNRCADARHAAEHRVARNRIERKEVVFKTFFEAYINNFLDMWHVACVAHSHYGDGGIRYGGS